MRKRRNEVTRKKTVKEAVTEEEDRGSRASEGREKRVRRGNTRGVEVKEEMREMLVEK